MKMTRDEMEEYLLKNGWEITGRHNGAVMTFFRHRCLHRFEIHLAPIRAYYAGQPLGFYEISTAEDIFEELLRIVEERRRKDDCF